MRLQRLGLAGVLALAGCVTDDFRVVDALHEGMTKEQAGETIAAYGFVLETALDRPAAGWPESDGSFENLPGRARRVEEDVDAIIPYAECYPVGHGMLGFGLLYLFYDESGRLARYYRWQVN